MTTISSGGKIYVNTLVFSIVSALMALALLMLLIWGPSQVRDFAFLIVTVELGLVCVMVASIIRIYMYERSLRKKAETAKRNLVMVDTCPDYWTATNTPTGTLCKNTYTAPRATNVSYVFGDDASGMPKQINLTEMSRQKLPSICEKVNTYNKIAWTDLKSTCSSYGLLTQA